MLFDPRGVSLKGNVYDFSVDYNVINKSDILNIHKYLVSWNYGSIKIQSKNKK